jgi:signal transduction histidine kinase
MRLMDRRESRFTAPRPSPPPILLGTAAVLLAGFGAVLGLMAVVGVYSIRVVDRLQTRNEQIVYGLSAGARLLERIRSSLYLSGTYIRDYLLDPDPRAAAVHLAQFRKLQSEINSNLAEYAGTAAKIEPDALFTLNQRLLAYWRAFGPVFAWTARERRMSGYGFLTRTLIPQRAQVLAAADEIARLNDDQVQESGRRSAALFRSFRTRMAVTVGLLLVLGGLVASFSVGRTLRLAREARERHAEILRTRSKLERLSAMLVGAQEQERRSVSRELHDEIGQPLTAVIVDLGNAAVLVPTDRTDLRDALSSIKERAGRVVGSVRNMALLLRPSMLDDLGLVPALQWQARETLQRTGMGVELSADDVPDELPDEHKTCIYRFVQEALHNAARHAKASLTQVVVRQEPRRILVLVQDNGQGFDARYTRGLGLIGIDERVRQLGGCFEVRSQPGKGTVLEVELPLADAAMPAEGQI